MIEKVNKALFIFCFETVVCKTSSVKSHFESVHNNISNKTEEEKRELISSALSKTKKQADNFMNFISGRSNSLVATSFEVSKVITQHEKPLFFYFLFLFYLYIYPPDSQESDEGANT